MTPIGPTPPPRTGGLSPRARRSLLIGCAVLVLSLFVGAIYLGSLAGSSREAGEISTRTDANEPSAAGSPTLGGNSATDQAEPEDGPGTDLPDPTTPTSPEQGSTLDSPRRPTEDGISPEVWRESEGKSCATSRSKTTWGGYPVATCRFWKKATGLTTGERVNKGTRRIACQRNLGIDNPVYTAKQTNTWWVWTQSAQGIWDWFPETAIAEGASDQAINGIASCI